MKLLIRAAAALLFALTGWAVFENTALLTVRRDHTSVKGLPRLVMVSDLHRRRFGKDQKRLLQKIAACKPEYIVLTGDLLSRHVRELAETETLLRNLRAIAPVLSVSGNHEVDLPPSLQKELRDIMRRCDIIDLNNRTKIIGGIPFAGLSLSRGFYRDGGHLGFLPAKRCTADIIEAVLGQCEPNTILLAHNPLYFPAYAEWGARLTLSGHVHGGAVRLPLLGGLLSPERTFFPRYSKGLYRLGRAELIVSSGLGKLRLFNPPELRVVTGPPPTGDDL